MKNEKYFHITKFSNFQNSRFFSKFQEKKNTDIFSKLFFSTKKNNFWSDFFIFYLLDQSFRMQPTRASAEHFRAEGSYKRVWIPGFPQYFTWSSVASQVWELGFWRIFPQNLGTDKKVHELFVNKETFFWPLGFFIIKFLHGSVQKKLSSSWKRI